MKKRTAAVVISFLCAAIVVLGVYSIMMRNRNVQLEWMSDVANQRAFAELVTGVSGVDTALQKSVYAVTPTIASAICTEVFGRAMTAEMALEILPFSTAETEQVAGFINKVGDYSLALSRAAASGREFSDDERGNLRALSDTASILALNLTQLQSDLSDGVLTMDELEDMENRMNKAAETMDASTIGGGIQLIEQEFPEIPSLVYDGPFSEHLSNPEAELLKSSEKVDENTARKAAARFLGFSEGKVYSAGTGGGDMPCYYFSAEDDNVQYTVGITERGAYPASMTCYVQPGEAKLTIDEGVDKAKEFLAQRGFDSMAESYHMTQNGIVTVNFAYEQDGVICYSDLVKVCVALDTGKVCGFEAKGYILNHKPRELAAPAVGTDTARQSVPSELELISESVALVPTSGQYEVLCYEFVCKTEDDRKYIIYVNAETGQQEKLLILLEDESGSLTI